MGEFKMPSLGADMEAGTVLRWLVKPGDRVRRGDIVAEVETEKSDIEVEIFENGVVQELLVHEGEQVPVGAVLAQVAPLAPSHPAGGTPRQSLPPAALTPQTVLSPVTRHLADRLGVDLATVAGTGPGGSVTRADVEQAAPAVPAAREPRDARSAPSSPLARRVAAELGVALSGLKGTGPGGSIVERDVRSAAAAGPQSLPKSSEESSTKPDHQAGLRRRIGALMARSKREIPHYYLSTTIDIGAAKAWLQRENLQRTVRDRLVLAALLVKATALAAAEIPEMNGFFTGGEFKTSAEVHVGVAVSLRSGGVIAPAIHDTDRLGLDDLMGKLRDLVTRARAGTLRSSEMSDSTITVTNLGDLGVETVFGVIYPPQVALVGFGQVTERAVAVNGLLGVAPCLTTTLSADHRASDGHRGGRFLARINQLLQEPEKL